MTTLKKFSVLLSPAAYGCLRGAAAASDPKGSYDYSRYVRIGFEAVDPDFPESRRVTFCGSDSRVIAVLAAPLASPRNCYAPDELLHGLTPFDGFNAGELSGFCLPACCLQDVNFPKAGRWARLDFEETQPGLEWRCFHKVYGGRRKVRLLKEGDFYMRPFAYPDESRVLPSREDVEKNYDRPADLYSWVLQKFADIGSALSAPDTGRGGAVLRIRTVGNRLYADVDHCLMDCGSYYALSGRVYAMGMRL